MLQCPVVTAENPNPINLKYIIRLAGPYLEFWMRGIDIQKM